MQMLFDNLLALEKSNECLSLLCDYILTESLEVYHRYRKIIQEILLLSIHRKC